MTNPAKPSGNPNKYPITYAESGVDIDAGNALVEHIKPLAHSTKRAGADSDLGGFGGLFDLKQAGYRDPVLVAATDGVGTKLKIAIESGNNETVGIDLVAMCVNDLIVQGAEPLFFLDYMATGKLDVSAATDIIAGIAEGCRQAGCALIGGETAEMPGLYASKDYDLAGFSVGAVERDAILPRTNIKPGDIALGLPSSGLHSNGYSLVRKLVNRAQLNWSDPAPWNTEDTLANELLTPTRIYVKPVIRALRGNAANAIKALAHITGGGLTENIPRILNNNTGVNIDLSAWQPPDVFSWTAQQAAIGQAEMLKTFNCGIGLVVIADAGSVDAVKSHLREAGQPYFVIGEVFHREASDEAITYRGELGLAP